LIGPRSHIEREGRIKRLEIKEVNGVFKSLKHVANCGVEIGLIVHHAVTDPPRCG
jgi:hypothetical protein